MSQTRQRGNLRPSLAHRSQDRTPSDALELRFVDLVLSDLGRHAAPRQAAELGAAADAAAGLLQGLADVLLLQLRRRLAEQLQERLGQVNLERPRRRTRV